MATDAMLFSAAADRNKGAILGALLKLLPLHGTVLEIASGSGQHVVHFAEALPHLTFRPSDPSPEARASIAAHAARSKARNIEAPRAVDVLVPGWEQLVDAIVCINMIHISPEEATLALFRGAATCLSPESYLILYGPFRFHGSFLAESNAAFDASLRQRDPRWGVRDIDFVDAIAKPWFDRAETIALPANNHLLAYRRRGVD